ncbi:ankyrin-1-like isoform X2 [Mytilus californianus]|uniref:ankyrin-1-like isoform X2 n=1 Tax=Mytilus californianus TaxID=6549 RepID=UPI002246FE3B|nr:ankyrin-1-like isoform X2 [Mytilus californianus]
MIILLRNLANFPEPAGGYDKLPLKTETTPIADLARIKHYRNHIAHFKNGKMNSAFFTIAWEDISGAVGRLSGHYMDEECKDLRTKHLDQSTVPWNIREQNSQILKQWQKNDVNFVETKASTHVLKCIKENSCVTIIASSGVGKTATLQHVVLKMADEGYDALLVTNPQDIIRFYYPNRKALYVIDDFCGTYSINETDLKNWDSVMKRIKELIEYKHIKIIVACRLQVYLDEKFESLSVFKINVCNLLSEDLCLSSTEKKSIAAIYLKTEASCIINYIDLHNCFPLMCKMYHDNPERNISDFFQNPFSAYEVEMEQIRIKGCLGKFCALSLCVMFNNELEEEVFTEDRNTEIRTIIENTCKACRLEKGTTGFTLLKELDSLEHTFIKKIGGAYKTINDKLFDFLSNYFGKYMIQTLIKNGHSDLIKERFVFEREDGMDQFITVVPFEYHDTYIQRIIDDWSNGKVVTVFCNKNMYTPKFRQILHCYLKTLDKTYQRQLAQTRDSNNSDTVLVQCCLKGDISLMQWCCDHGVDVNLCRHDGMTPLYLSSKEGNTQVVKLLLDNRATINKCINNKASPLFVACQKGYIETVQMLLDNQADINKCTNDEMSPLFIACQNSHLDIVKSLLDNKASINKCMYTGASPLFVACQNGNSDIAKLLLDNDANIDKCMNEEVSPLYIACQEGYADIVQLLMNNNADINKCMDDETSPLYIACQNNHLQIVQLLLASKSDIDECLYSKVSPLFIACLKGYHDIVKLLLLNITDINICMNNIASPLYIACQNNHLQIVKILLDHKAEIDTSMHYEASPLFIACQRGYTDIVQLLLNNNADSNKCISGNASPLYIACQNNHIKIAKLLLGNNADINRCLSDGTSPLFTACQNNCVDIVKLLLYHNADVNKSTTDDVSPLFIACQKGFEEVVQLLLDNQLEIDKCTSNEISPLFISCQNKYVDIVKLLVDNNADVNKCTKDDKSPLFIACHNGCKDIVQILLDNNANIDKRMKNEISPLFIACQNKHADIVKLLIDNRADINTFVNVELSPLFIACQQGCTDIVQLLLDNKADINQCMKDKITPLFIA